MDNVFINLGDMVSIGQDSVTVFDSDSLVSTSDALVGPQGPPGPPGPKGDSGIDGQDGRNATIAIGTTTTGNPGTNASVVNTGTETDAVLNFVIPRGEQGEQGIQGEQGEPGNDGAAATIQVGSVITVAADYPATVTNSGTTSAAVLDFQIPRGIQGEQGIPGQDGQDGQDGAPGQAATIAVGTTTTGAAGTNASVTNSGTSSAAVFNFTIPRGADGQNGQDGQDGAPGAAATVAVGTTTTGSAGTNASVTNSGTSSAAVLNFTIPRGADGQNGQNGQDGAAATVTVGSTTTGAAGTNASVTNSGTSSAAVLDFVIPRGADGTSETPTFVDGTGDSLDCTAVKYPSGLMICYGAKYYSGINVNSSYQGSYYGSLNMSNVYPVAFTSTPTTTVTLYNSGKLITCNFSNRSTSGFNLYIWGQTSTTNMNLTVNYIAIGKWK